MSVFLLAMVSTAAGQTIYVDASATGANDGSSWGNAYKYLQDALTVAGSGDEIRVAEGVYKPDEDTANPTGTGDRTATFHLKNGVAIYGGFGGDSILSGDLNGDDGWNFANNSENSYHVVTGNGTKSTAVLDGFTITAGNADGSDPHNNGGGMYCESGSPTLANCTFSENSANGGGGMHNLDSSPSVTNCTFSENSAINNGGGMHNKKSHPTVTNCTFSENSAINNGGGIYNNNSHPNITNCTFRENSAKSGGGMRNSEDSSPTVTNCTFRENSAEDGGGMRNSYYSGPTVTNCTFSENSAEDGGGMRNAKHSSPNVINCILWGGWNKISNSENSTITVSYSDVQGGWPGIGNIDAAPLFADADLRLSAGSPCIDAGDNSAVLVATDLDGNQRIVNGIVDMGAYENADYIADYLIVDDFEDYNDYPPYRIFDTWIDGWGVPTNGSTVGYLDPPFAEQSIVHGGSQSMPYFYENNFKYSEATMTLIWPRDWTEEGVGVLSLWFYGDASNAAEPMYVALNGSAVVYHDNPNAALIDTWTEWTIDLQEFAAQGVNLANVNTISIGFGDKNNLQAGGSGLVFFDDIRLY